MDIITSSQNPKIKPLIKAFMNSRSRKKAGLTLLDGVSLVADYLATDLDYELMIFDEAKLSYFDVSQLLNQVNANRRIVVSSSVFAKLTQVQTSPGVLAVIKTPINQPFIKDSTIGARLVLLDRVQDPGNLGTILRTSLAVGVKTIILSDDSVEAFSPKVIRASMGACFKLNIYQQANLADVIKQLKPDYQILVTSSHAQQNIYQLDLNSKTAWLLGNESNGVSEELFVLANRKVIIPQELGVESLNLAVAASVCLYEQYRQINF